MSEPTSSQSKPNPTRSVPYDEGAFAQVEKWMAMIREIGGEQQTQLKLQS